MLVTEQMRKQLGLPPSMMELKRQGYTAEQISEINRSFCREVKPAVRLSAR